MYGVQVSQNCALANAGTPTALWIYNYSSSLITVSGVNIRFAPIAIIFSGYCGAAPRLLKDATIEFCVKGVYASNAGVTISNSICSNVTTPSYTDACGSVTGTWSLNL
jgi:hypothetical protein